MTPDQIAKITMILKDPRVPIEVKRRLAGELLATKIQGSGLGLQPKPAPVGRGERIGPPGRDIIADWQPLEPGHTGHVSGEPDMRAITDAWMAQNMPGARAVETIPGAPGPTKAFPPKSGRLVRNPLQGGNKLPTAKDRMAWEANLKTLEKGLKAEMGPGAAIPIRESLENLYSWSSKKGEASRMIRDRLINRLQKQVARYQAAADKVGDSWREASPIRAALDKISPEELALMEAGYKGGLVNGPRQMTVARLLQEKAGIPPVELPEGQTPEMIPNIPDMRPPNIPAEEHGTFGFGADPMDEAEIPTRGGLVGQTGRDARLVDEVRDQLSAQALRSGTGPIHPQDAWQWMNDRMEELGETTSEGQEYYDRKDRLPDPVDRHTFREPGRTYNEAAKPGVKQIIDALDKPTPAEPLSMAEWKQRLVGLRDAELLPKGFERTRAFKKMMLARSDRDVAAAIHGLVRGDELKATLLQALQGTVQADPRDRVWGKLRTAASLRKDQVRQRLESGAHLEQGIGDEQLHKEIVYSYGNPKVMADSASKLQQMARAMEQGDKETFVRLRRELATSKDAGLQLLMKNLARRRKTVGAIPVIEEGSKLLKLLGR